MPKCYVYGDSDAVPHGGEGRQYQLYILEFKKDDFFHCHGVFASRAAAEAFIREEQPRYPIERPCTHYFLVREESGKIVVRHARGYDAADARDRAEAAERPVVYPGEELIASAESYSALKAAHAAALVEVR